jgi:hypothetical protein
MPRLFASVDLPVDLRMHIGTPLSGDHQMPWNLHLHKFPVRMLGLLFAVADDRLGRAVHTLPARTSCIFILGRDVRRTCTWDLIILPIYVSTYNQECKAS